MRKGLSTILLVNNNYVKLRDMVKGEKEKGVEEED